MKITENHLDRLKDAINNAQNNGDCEFVAYIRFDSRKQALSKLREIDKSLKAWKPMRTSWRSKFWEDGDWFVVTVTWDCLEEEK